MRFEAKSGLLELSAQFPMVEYFAVEYQHNIAVRTLQRLVARFKIENPQPCGAE